MICAHPPHTQYRHQCTPLSHRIADLREEFNDSIQYVLKGQGRGRNQVALCQAKNKRTGDYRIGKNNWADIEFWVEKWENPEGILDPYSSDEETDDADDGE